MLRFSSFDRNIIAPPQSTAGLSSGCVKPVHAFSRQSIAKYGDQVRSLGCTYSKA